MTNKMFTGVANKVHASNKRVFMYNVTCISSSRQHSLHNHRRDFNQTLTIAFLIE